MRRIPTLVLATAFLAACSGATGSTPGDDDDDDALDCSDVDGDGRGTGADCTGPDCDDANAEVWDAVDCEALCGDDPHATGCPCDAEKSPEPEICYGAPDDTIGIGPCTSGLRECAGGEWTSCLGQVVPVDEECNEVDDDCDGVADDGLPIGPCGTCSEDCEEECVGAGEGCEGFDVDDEGTNVVACEGLPPEECVTLGGVSELTHTLIWIASARGGTVSKIDTRERVEQARYWTGPLGESDWYLSGPGDGPSRTSVDRNGDVVVANRAFNAQSSVTRIAADDCPDADGDGEVETSTGPADVLPWGTDECVLWNTPVGGNNAVARGLVSQDRIGLDGVLGEYAWAGLYYENRWVELDRADGSATGEEADCAPCNPYGGAVDRDGNLWSACISYNLCRFDTEDTTDVEVLTGPTQNYGITVDADGLVWYAGGGLGDTLTSYDPAAEEFTEVPGAAGAGVAIDANGDIWVGQCNTIYGFGIGATCRVDHETLEVTEMAAHARGVAIDTDGFVWGVSMSGYIDLVDPGAGPGDETIERIFDDCGAGADACLFEPYTYSDMTGFQLENATDPLGTYAHVFEGCADGTTWDFVTYEATIPEGSGLGFEVRSADDLAGLHAAAFVDVGSADDHPSPVALDVALGDGPHGRYLEVRVRLLSIDGEARPSLTGLGAQHHCGGGVG